MATSLATTEHLLTRPEASTRERLVVGFTGGALGAATAALRVEAGQHFPSDVLVGSAIGIATGVTLPLAHADGPGPTRRAQTATMTRLLHHFADTASLAGVGGRPASGSGGRNGPGVGALGRSHR